MQAGAVSRRPNHLSSPLIHHPCHTISNLGALFLSLNQLFIYSTSFRDHPERSPSSVALLSLHPEIDPWCFIDADLPPSPTTCTTQEIMYVFLTCK